MRAHGGGPVATQRVRFPWKMPVLLRAHPNLASICRPYLWATWVVAALASITGLLEGIGISLLIPLLASFSPSFEGGNQNRAMALLEHFLQGYSHSNRIVLVGGVILGLVILKCLLQACSAAFSAWITGRLGYQIIRVLGRRLHSAHYPFFLENEPGRLLNVLTTEAWKVAETILLLLQQIATAMTVVVFGLLLFLVSWRLSLVLLLGGLLARHLQRRFEHRLRRLGTHTVRYNEALGNRMLTAVFGARVIRLFHTQDLEQERLEAVADNLRVFLLKSAQVMAVRGPILESARTALLLVVLLTAILYGASLPVLAAFLALMNRLQPHLQLLEQSSASLASASAHFDEVEWLLAAASAVPEQMGRHPLAHFSELRFDEVTFQYPSRNEPAIENVSFVLRRGAPTALVGQSGSGKSTIIHLLTRLLQPTRGVILVNETPLSEIRLLDWLAACAVAGQDIDLVDGTIAENVAYGNAGLERSLVEEAIRSASAEFVYNLPQGLDTVVGRLGLGLSGGQRQRIGIARALARKPDFLILDEATNAIDEETEGIVVSTLRSLPKEMLVLVVSHRPTTLAFCTEQIVLSQGRVVRSGTTSSPGDGDRNFKSETIVECIGG